MKQCAVCGNDKNLKYLPTSGYAERDDSRIFFSGGIYLCEDCLSLCVTCEKCGSLIPTENIKSHLGSMDCSFFCHCCESETEKNERIKKENIRLIEAQKAKIQRKTDRQNEIEAAKIEEQKVIKTDNENFADYIIILGTDLYILDKHLASILNISTKEIRTITKENLFIFIDSEVKTLDWDETEILKEDFPGYITSEPPFAFDIRGCFKLISLLKNEKSIILFNDIFRSLLSDELFSSDDKKIQLLFNSLTDTYSYEHVKEKRKETIRKIEEYGNEIRELKEYEQESISKIHNLFAYLMLSVSIIIILIFHIIGWLK